MYCIPFARTDSGTETSENIMSWLHVDELLEKTQHLSPDEEFQVLLLFLAEFAGGREIAEHRMTEMLVEQAAESYNAYAIAVQKISNRLHILYKLAKEVQA